VKILVVDDDPALVEAVEAALLFQWPGAAVLTAYGGEEGVAVFDGQEPDLVLLDLNMPGHSGFDVLRDIRRMSTIPVLVLSARTAEEDVVRALDLGADDYLTKPFSHLELLARVKGLMRRVERGAALPTGSAIKVGELVVDFNAERAHLRGEPLDLTPAEYKLLYHLARNGGRLVPHKLLIERVWGSEWGASTGNLKALVARLRAKIEPDPDSPRLVENERGLGYRFVRPAPNARAAAEHASRAREASSG
jgi:DNA-binding response OmpR family regulator